MNTIILFDIFISVIIILPLLVFDIHKQTKNTRIPGKYKTLKKSKCERIFHK